MFALMTRTLPRFSRLQYLKLFKLKRHKNLSTCIKTFNPQCNFSFSYSLNKCSITSKQYSTKIKIKERLFIDSENKYVYNILQTIPVVDKDLFIYKLVDKSITAIDDFNQFLDQDWRSSSANDIVNAFKSVSNFCINNGITVADTRFDKLVDGLMDHVQDLSDNELSDLLTCLAEYLPCETYKAHNFHDIWSALDDVCCWRIDGWSNDTRFWFAERWYKFNLGRVSQFLFIFLMRLEKRLIKCTKDQLLHTYFYARIKDRQNMPFEYQGRLDGFIKDMPLNEISIAMITLARNRVKPKLTSTCEVVIAKLIENLPQTDETCILNILTVLRYSSHVLLVDQLMNLLDHLVPEIDRLSIIACVHVALLGTTLQFFHKESLAKISQKVVDNIENARLKDMERLLVALTMFDFDPKTTPDIFTTIYSEIHKQNRISESITYNRCLQSLLSFLCIKNMYSYQLMDHVLNPSLILETYGKKPRALGHDIFSLDICIDIECPDYKGYRLDKEFRKKITKWNTEYVPERNQPYKLTWTDNYFLEIVDVLCQIVPKREFIHCSHLLPNYVKPDIVVCKDTNGYFVEPNGFERYQLGDIMYPPNKDLKWYAIVALTWNMVIRGTIKPLGLYNMKYRQLKRIGYEPILMISNEFVLLNKEQKISHIADKIR